MYRSSWETWSTLGQEIISLCHALLDIYLNKPERLRSQKNKTIYCDLVHVIVILELKLNPTLSDGRRHRILRIG